MNSVSSKEVREVKVSECTRIVNRHDINLITLNELGHNFGAVESSQNLASWFESERDKHSVLSNNEHNPALSRHQQGGVGMACFHEFLVRSQHDEGPTSAWKDLLVGILGQP